MQKTSVKGKKSIHFQCNSVHNLQTPGGIHKENVTLLEAASLINYGKGSSCSPENWASLYQKSSS